MQCNSTALWYHPYTNTLEEGKFIHSVNLELQVGRHDYVSNLVTVRSMRSSPHMRKILY